MAFSLSPDDKTLAYVWPNGDDYELRLMSISVPAARMLLTKSEGLPLAPKFSSDGKWVYFSEYSISFYYILGSTQANLISIKV
jgi:Tol biopolymer transport system component